MRESLRVEYPPAGGVHKRIADSYDPPTDTTRNPMRQTQQYFWAACMAASLAACGGGGSGTVAAPAASTLSGTAAVGFPIVGGAVSVKCAAGPALGAATTSSVGAWSVSVSGQTLPCAVQVSGGTINSIANLLTYQSIGTAAGTVNITPLTTLLTANLAGTATPASWFSALTTGQIGAINATLVNAALANLKTALGLTQLNGINPVTLAFNAAPGVVMDDILAALATAQTNAGVTFAQLMAAAGAGAGSSFSAPAGLGIALTTAYAGTTSGAGGGGGGGGVSGALGTLTVTAASNAADNGNYALTGASFTNSTESGYNGYVPVVGNFETEIVWASNATIKRAHLWITHGTTLKFYGCDASVGLPCTGVAYEPLLKQVWFTNVVWHEVTPDLTGATPDVLVSSGETLTVNGKLDAQ